MRLKRSIRKLAAIALAILILILWTPLIAYAAPRPSWVKAEIYQYNHSFAVQLPQELDTKMEKMAGVDLECNQSPALKRQPNSLRPFSFYRGTAHIFYKDMLTLPASKYISDTTSAVWLQGDMHLQNLSAFRDGKDNSIFDTYDFDEGYLGPYVWDLRRMAVGILLIAEESGLQSEGKDIVRAFLDAYLNQMKDFSETDAEQSFNLNIGNTKGVVEALIQEVSKKAPKDALKDLDKITKIDRAKRTFNNEEDLQKVPGNVQTKITAAMEEYVASIAPGKRYKKDFYTLKDIHQKLGSGTGSLGRYRYWLLIEGASTDANDDRILEVKQETSSAVAIAAPNRLPKVVYNAHEGKRVAMTMKAVLQNTDPLLGYTTVNGVPYMVREKSLYQEDFDYLSKKCNLKLTDKAEFAEAMSDAGKVLAKNHALADQDYNPKIVPYNVDKEITAIISGHKEEFKDETLAFATDYAEQVKLDYTSFLATYRQKEKLY